MRRTGPLALLLLLARAAGAVEGESSLSLSPRYAHLAVTQRENGRSVDLSGGGGGLVVDWQRALSDTLWLRLAVSGGAFSVASQAAFAGTATVGLTYTVDVLKYVPYLGVALGGVVVGGGRLDGRGDVILEGGAGVDVLQSTTWSWGVDARYAFGGRTSLLLVGPRFSWRWGFF